MAFKTWQIGLHIQQHEALAIAVIRGASGWSLATLVATAADERLHGRGYDS
ncbi:DNA utilization protein HofM [Salmonella enterica subsp. enterica]|uniref:DNA utilization protein HofM n=1 Tax=Salmonella enterica I TaxID=59201 RepID=A0A3S4LTM1_SALET|nr:DNA utilization protein HofM [Salmonella enterica subsp. enterica]